jgi:hypothetical protein
MDGTRLHDLLVQLCGLRVGRRAELALQHLHAELILAQCGLPASEPRIELHDRTMDGLLQVVHLQQTKTGLDGRLVIASFLLIREQTAQALDR